MGLCRKRELGPIRSVVLTRLVVVSVPVIAHYLLFGGRLWMFLSSFLTFIRVGNGLLVELGFPGRDVGRVFCVVIPGLFLFCFSYFGFSYFVVFLVSSLVGCLLLVFYTPPTISVYKLLFFFLVLFDVSLCQFFLFSLFFFVVVLFLICVFVCFFFFFGICFRFFYHNGVLIKSIFKSGGS